MVRMVKVFCGSGRGRGGGSNILGYGMEENITLSHIQVMAIILVDFLFSFL